MFPQVTLEDVHARIASLGLDVDSFLEQTRPALRDASGERDDDLVQSLFLPDAKLGEAGVDEVWQALAAKVRGGAVLAHPSSPTWTGLAETARRAPRWRTAHVIRPSGVRTLMTSLDKPSWDFRLMPDDAIGASGTEDELYASLWSALRPTTGGAEYLEPDPETRALIVLATTVAAVLSEEVATKSDHRRGIKLVRPDVYERTIEGMGLGACLQAVRRLLEIDHPAHVPLRAAWPTARHPVRDVGILEYRGRREPYLALNAPALPRLR